MAVPSPYMGDRMGQRVIVSDTIAAGWTLALAEPHGGLGGLAGCCGRPDCAADSSLAEPRTRTGEKGECEDAVLVGLWVPDLNRTCHSWNKCVDTLTAAQ